MWQDLILKKYNSISIDYTVSKSMVAINKDKFVVVMKGNSYYGIVTKKSLLRVGVSLPDEKIKNITFRAPILTRTMDSDAVAELFVNSGMPALVVFDGNKIDGVLTRTDFLKEVVAAEIGAEKVEAVATRDVVTVKPSDNLAKALSLFKEHNISKLVVVDSEVKGVISITNILNYFVNSSKLNVDNLKSTLVKNIMKEEVYFVTESDTLKKAIDTFAKNQTSSLVVFSGKIFNKKHSLFGIITKTDILMRYLAEFKKNKVKINIVSKLENIDRTVIESKLATLEKVLDRGTEVFVSLKKGKERFRGMPLINCRLRIAKAGKTENISVEGWGLEHSLELAVTKIKRRLSDIDIS